MTYIFEKSLLSSFKYNFTFPLNSTTLDLVGRYFHVLRLCSELREKTSFQSIIFDFSLLYYLKIPSLDQFSRTWDPTKEYSKTTIFRNCHLAITRVKFVYLIDASVLRRKLNRRFHNKRGMR